MHIYLKYEPLAFKIILHCHVTISPLYIIMAPANTFESDYYLRQRDLMWILRCGQLKSRPSNLSWYTGFGPKEYIW